MLFLQSALFYHSNHDTERIRGFYSEPPHSLDVVVLGASEVYSGFSSAYAYEYSGLTSYIYAYGSNPGSLYLSQLKEILSRQNPQLIVVEINGFLQGATHMSKEVDLRHYAENIPFSLNKVRAILEYDYSDKLSCLVPFLKYHGQWPMTQQEVRARFAARPRFESVPTRLKGAYTLTAINEEIPEIDVTDDAFVADLDPVALSHLTRFLDGCKALNVNNLLFVRFPHKIMGDKQYERYGRTNQAKEIINRYGYDFLNLEKDWLDVGVDHQFDFSDIEHMNIYGMQKITEYLCDVFTDTYGLSPMPQTDANAARWNESLSFINAFMNAAQARMDEGVEEPLYESDALLSELRASMEL